MLKQAHTGLKSLYFFKVLLELNKNFQQIQISLNAILYQYYFAQLF